MISPAIATDRFTWSRVVAMIRLMSPRLRTVTAWYLIAGLLASGLIFLCSHLPFGIKLFSLVVSIPAMLFYISPVFVMDTMDARQMNNIPATPGEKLTAAAFWVFIVLGIISYLLPSIVAKFILLNNNTFGGVHIGDVMTIVTNMSTPLWILNWFSGALPAIICCYTMVRYPGRRWRAVGMTILTIVIEGMMGAAYGIFAAFRMGFEAAANGNPIPDDRAVEQFAIEIISDILPFVWIFSQICAIAAVWFAWLTYRKLKTRQL